MYLCIDRQNGGGGGGKRNIIWRSFSEISMSFNFQELIGID